MWIINYDDDDDDVFQKDLILIVPFRPKLTPCIFQKLSIRGKFLTGISMKNEKQRLPPGCRVS